MWQKDLKGKKEKKSFLENPLHIALPQPTHQRRLAHTTRAQNDKLVLAHFFLRERLCVCVEGGRRDGEQQGSIEGKGEERGEKVRI